MHSNSNLSAINYFSGLQGQNKVFLYNKSPIKAKLLHAFVESQNTDLMLGQGWVGNENPGGFLYKKMIRTKNRTKEKRFMIYETFSCRDSPRGSRRSRWSWTNAPSTPSTWRRRLITAMEDPFQW